MTEVISYSTEAIGTIEWTIPQSIIDSLESALKNPDDLERAKDQIKLLFYSYGEKFMLVFISALHSGNQASHMLGKMDRLMSEMAIEHLKYLKSIKDAADI
jgi:hypothetical protein